MMSLSLTEARILAEEVKQILAPACERIEVAGSVRRGKAGEIKDVELVAVPKFAMEEIMPEHFKVRTSSHAATDTLDQILGIPLVQRRVNMLDKQLRFYVENPELSTQRFSRGDNRGPNRTIKAPFSERYYAIKYKDRPVDLFVCLPPAQFGVLLAIRTGSWEFSKWLVQQGWSKGIKFQGGQMVQGLDDYAKPLPIDPKTRDWAEPPPRIVRLLPCPEEKGVFEYLGIPWIEPSERNMPPQLVVKSK